MQKGGGSDLTMAVNNSSIVDRFATPQFVLCLALVAIFTGAYFNDPSDKTMGGAIIAAFSASWGYYLGSSRGSTAQSENMGKVLDLATGPKEVIVSNSEDNPIPVEPSK
jgi:hypothetical protein